MITNKRYAIRNGVRPIKKKHSLFGGGGLFTDQERLAQREISEQQEVAEGESIPDPAIEAVSDAPTSEEQKASKKDATIQGGLKGAKIGASVGSIIPGIGTLVGGAVGGLIGGFAANQKYDPNDNLEDPNTAQFGGRVRVTKKFAPGGVIEDDTKKGLFRKDKRDLDTPGQDRLALAAANQMSAAYDPVTEDLTRTETDPQLGGFIKNELFPQVSDLDYDPTKTPWSAATVTDLGRAYNPEFKGGIGHYQYINQAFEDNRGLKKGGTHRPVNLQGIFDRGDTLAAGTILFRGRDDPKNPERSTKGFSFGDFRKGSKKDSKTFGYKYSSHTDMIVNTVTGENGETRYLVQGGNRGKLGVLKSDYLTAEQIQARYPGALVPNREHSGAQSQPGDLGGAEVTAYR